MWEKRVGILRGLGFCLIGPTWGPMGAQEEVATSREEELMQRKPTILEIQVPQESGSELHPAQSCEHGGEGDGSFLHPQKEVG